MKKYLTVGLLLMIFKIQAQYVDAVGIRAGLYNGITYKHFFMNETAVEGILHTRWSGLEVVGLLENHQDLSPDGLSWYWGYGAHLGFYDSQYTNWYESGSTTVVGIDGIIGLEFIIPNSPIAVGFDWKPYFNIIGHSGLYADGGALSLRYTF